MELAGYTISLMLSDTRGRPPFPGPTIEVDRVELSAAQFKELYMDPRFVIKRNGLGEVLGGDDVLDDALKFEAARQDAQIIDTRTGEVVYDGGPSGIDPDDN